MNRLFICLMLLVLAGCGVSQPSNRRDVVAQVGIMSSRARNLKKRIKIPAMGRKVRWLPGRTFLNNMINQKLILLDAENKGPG